MRAQHDFGRVEIKGIMQQCWADVSEAARHLGRTCISGVRWD